MTLTDELSRVLRYSTADHSVFQRLIHKNPMADQTDRGAYADYLQERDAHHDEATLAALRDPSIVSLQVHTLPTGKVWAGKDYGIVGIRRHNEAEGYHWFDRDTMRSFGTRLNGDVFHGPGGVYFATSDRDWNGTRTFTVRTYDPTTGNVGTASHPVTGEGRLEAPNLASAKKMAKELAVQDHRRWQ